MSFLLATLLGIDTYGCPTISKIYNGLFLGSYMLRVNLDVIIKLSFDLYSKKAIKYNTKMAIKPPLGHLYNYLH